MQSARIPGTSRWAVLLMPLLFVGCAWFGGEEEDAEEADVTSTRQMLYESAQRSLRTGNFSDSVTRLERLEARYPFGPYAEQAQLELIYANYMAWDIEAARNAADRFIRLHPQHPNVDYAYYMRGLAATARSRGVLNRIFAIDESKRDVTTARKAWGDFDEFLKLFPSSEYARDARQRMIHLRNVLARSEVHVAIWYMSRGAYVAAANRARYAIENYSQTPAAPDALAILVESSWKLGLTETANDTLRVLALNYPEYRGFDDSGNLVLAAAIQNRDRSWMNMVTFGLLDRPETPPPLRIRQPEQVSAVSPPATPTDT